MAEFRRRSLLAAALYGMWGGMAMLMAIPASMYLLWAPKRRTGEQWAAAGALDALQPGQPVELSFERSRRDAWQVLSERNTAWVVRYAGRRIVAFSPRCTHLGCAYHWDAAQTRFVCPCHMSAFSLEGAVLAGPASRPLERFQTKVQNNLILIGELRDAG